jgi:hypothetical protein
MLIFGKGAVQDTYNMLAECIYHIIRALAAIESPTPEAFASEHDLTRYVVQFQDITSDCLGQ